MSCIICGHQLPQGRRKYCSDACAAEAARQRDRYGKPHDKPPPLRWAECCDCGAAYYGSIKSIRCPACQHAADAHADAEYRTRKAAGKSRTLGSIDLCVVCGEPYTVASGKQKYCPACRETATRAACRDQARTRMADARKDPTVRETINARKRRVPQMGICKQCGAEYKRASCSDYCSAECRAAAHKAYHQTYDARRRDAQRAKSKTRYHSLTQEQRDAINASARKSYAKRKTHKEGTP